MWIGVITIFPNMFHNIINYGVIKKALQKKIISINIWNLRDFSKKKNKKIDDHPYGGGPGMVISAQPLKSAIQTAKKFSPKDTIVIYLSPQGKKVNQNIINKIAKHIGIILICGRYEGIDERIIKNYINEEWSIGDYIVSGGELPAMIIIDAITRLVPGLLNIYSIQEESFHTGLLDHPHYTRPADFEGHTVPNVLLSGNHKSIKKWKTKYALQNTLLKRPDLLQKIHLSNEQKKILKKIKKNNLF
ncbi:tRNA (guanosine(37)-N1)-methyltransferase TrmD [Buchnera aphidicola]|uniref:tRNA (guanine-N(1)-)-methyltransferase n=1 Tax=Buchnera aphidicola (Sarucallis kahawaluokalani) TaxID=1241878 RepID=A0A4D6Y9J3_9GAMM|nr:tRNA (guanosine(37)-N1)-methyltransferase TrmD [Buchnera aphidicola]QCI26059.1 tRNA (guanosine(37)-N1)-methyltransferase TrmD [Buchnera aphidicola (Sarucallis kahawaluokalani)]